MPRQLPGVTWTTFITRQRSLWCWMIIPTRSCVAGISIGMGPPGGAARRRVPSSTGARIPPTPVSVHDRASPCPPERTWRRRPAGVNGRTWPDALRNGRSCCTGAPSTCARARRLLRSSRMNPAVAPRALLPALVTRALASGGLHFACSLLLSPFAALASADATWLPSETDFDTEAPQPTPVVLVHAIFGATDVITPPPRHLRGRSVIVAGCGHLGLLYRAAALGHVAAFLAEPRPEAARALRAA